MTSASDPGKRLLRTSASKSPDPSRTTRGLPSIIPNLTLCFYFPIWGLPISRNSVSLIVHHSDGNDIDINIVDAIKTEGMLSNQNAEIDYTRGLIRFEAPPDDGIDTQITATWKRDYRYKRPDFLTRQLLKNTGIQDTLGKSQMIRVRDLP